MKQEDISLLKKRFSGCADFVVRAFRAGRENAAVCYLEGICDRKYVHDYILSPLTSLETNAVPVLQNTVSGGRLTEITSEAQAAEAILSGEAAVFCGEQAYSVLATSEVSRGIGEPETETVIRGPREGFSEIASVNIALIRRRIRSASLKCRNLTLGNETNTQVSVMYMENLADKKILTLLTERLEGIDIGAVTGSGTVEMCIQDGLCPLFPSVGNSERPDKVAAKLLEGRIAVIVGGSPTVLTVPFLLVETLQSSEDYSKSPYFASFMRLLRFISLLVALYLPALFVALFSHNPEAFPGQLAQKIAETRLGLPFSLFWETLLMLLIFEIIREAGLRMPRSVGGAVSLAAALILGDSAIDAGIASVPVLIVVAFAGICNFIVPPLMNAQTIARLVLLIAGAVWGLFGIGTVTALLILHLCAKASFTVPFFSPFAPLSGTGLTDSLIMVPVWAMKKTPAPITGKNITRARGKSRRKE